MTIQGGLVLESSATNVVNLGANMAKGRLIVAGSGIKFVSHLTIEVKAAIEQSDKVLYLVNEPLMKVWIQEHARDAQSLDFLYGKSVARQDSYQIISDHILAAIEDDKSLCVVLYGHPSVFATPALDAVKRARSEGVNCHILPGISAEDCLFADLAIDPGDIGCLSYEASYFLLYQPAFSVHAHLILWQPAVIGMQGHPPGDHDPRPGLAILSEHLLKFYPEDHPIISYQAAQYPQFSPTIHQYALSQLATSLIPRLATLYIPPNGCAVVNASVKQRLELTRRDLSELV